MQTAGRVFRKLYDPSFSNNSAEQRQSTHPKLKLRSLAKVTKYLQKHILLFLLVLGCILAAGSARAASAVEVERQRIERDLHDGGQQRLIALRMKLSVTARLLKQDLSRACQHGAALGQQGMGNTRERIAAVGGHLSIEHRPEGGFREAGWVLAPPLSAEAV